MMLLTLFVGCFERPQPAVDAAPPPSVPDSVEAEVGPLVTVSRVGGETMEGSAEEGVHRRWKGAGRAVSCPDGTLGLLLDTLEGVELVRVRTAGVQRVSLEGNAQRLGLLCGPDSALSTMIRPSGSTAWYEVLRWGSGEEKVRRTRFTGFRAYVRGLVPLADGQLAFIARVAEVSANPEVVLLDADGQRGRQVPSHAADMQRIEFLSPQGEALVALTRSDGSGEEGSDAYVLARLAAAGGAFHDSATLGTRALQPVRGPGGFAEDGFARGLWSAAPVAGSDGAHHTLALHERGRAWRSRTWLSDVPLGNGLSEFHIVDAGEEQVAFDERDVYSPVVYRRRDEGWTPVTVAEGPAHVADVVWWEGRLHALLVGSGRGELTIAGKPLVTGFPDGDFTSLLVPLD